MTNSGTAGFRGANLPTNKGVFSDQTLCVRSHAQNEPDRTECLPKLSGKSHKCPVINDEKLRKKPGENRQLVQNRHSGIRIAKVYPTL